MTQAGTTENIATTKCLRYFQALHITHKIFLSHMRGRFKADDAEQSPINKYTWVNNKTKSVFVKVPKLDYETDECTFPKKYNKAAAVEARKDPNRREAFEAMEQQNPIPLSSCPFMWARLRTYKELPVVTVQEWWQHLTLLVQEKTMYLCRFVLI